MVEVPANERTAELLSAALSYAKRGWRVIPLHNPDAEGRCSCGKADCGSPGKHPRTLHGLTDASVSETDIREWWTSFPLANIGIATGQASGLFVLDVDARHGGDDSLQGLKESFGPIPATVGAVTGTGEHLYFSHPGGFIQNSAGKLGDGLDIRGDGGYVVAPPSLHPSGRLYAWEGSGDPSEVPLAAAPPWLLNQLRARPLRRVDPTLTGAPDKVLERSRNIWLTSMAGSMRRRGFSPEAILAALSVENEARCDPPLDPVEVRTIAWSVGRYEPGDPIPTELAPGEIPLEDHDRDDWPAFPLDDSNKALHGLAGDFVGGIDPYTEADPAAVLVHFLVFFGNLIGRSAHLRVGGARHSGKLFAALVGDTATGRKGTAEADVRDIFADVDAAWTRTAIRHGMVSGEGLIRAFDLDDAGNPKEPRLMMVEPELVNVLQVISRDGSTLSGIVRMAWDSDQLEIGRSTKKNSVRVDGAHTSMMAHITQGELLRSLSTSSKSNGFANRFLWFLVRRSKSLPDSDPLPLETRSDLVRRICRAQEFAELTGEVARDPEAKQLWRELYPGLTSPPRGLLGKVTGRGHVQVIRLSLLYALLDASRTIRPDHILAGKALVDLSDACAARIFGDRLGDPLAARILAFFREADQGVLSRTEIGDALGRNYSGRAIDVAIELLVEDGHVERTDRPRTPGSRGPQAEAFQLADRQKGGNHS